MHFFCYQGGSESDVAESRPGSRSESGSDVMNGDINFDDKSRDSHVQNSDDNSKDSYKVLLIVLDPVLFYFTRNDYSIVED